MIIYWDFDGVLVDTWERIDKQKNELVKRDMWEFYSSLNWKQILQDSKMIDRNCCLMRRFGMKYNTKILTNFSSYDEAFQKASWLKKQWEDIEVVFVPYGIDKHSLVKCEDNILIDDNLSIINTWINNGGLGILYKKEVDIENEITKKVGEYIDKIEEGGR